MANVGIIMELVTRYVNSLVTEDWQIRDRNGQE